MASAPNQQSDEQDISSKKPRRSVIRSLSWKRPSKRTKMEEDGTTVENRNEVEASFNTTTSTAQGMSDEDAEDEIFDSTDASSKKRKKSGVWKAMKRFFSRKNSKGSKSFQAGDSGSPHGQPQRSVSDPNLAYRTGERPELAPLEQVDQTPMETEVSPKKAMSHDSLLSELRSKQGKSVDGEGQTSPKPSDVDWQTSPTSTPEQLLPGLNVSHDKIRVAPRHRRAPTRKGVASVRHGGRDITDANVIPRSKSVGARFQNALLEEPQFNEREQKALQQRNQKIRKEIEEEQRKQKEEEEQQELEKRKLEQKKLEMEKLEREKLEQQKLKQEKLEQERLEKQKIEEENLKQENLEKQKLEQQKQEQEELEQKRLKQKKLEEEKLEQERQRLVEQEEKQKIEQEKLQKEILEQEKREEQKREKERLDEEKLKQQEYDKLRQYSVQETTDFSDLVESLRPTDDSEEAYREETTEVQMKETTSVQKPDLLGDMTSAAETRATGVALYQNIDIVEKDVKAKESSTIKEQNMPAVLDLEITNTADDKQTEDYSQTASDFAVSPVVAVEEATASEYQEIRETGEVTIVELISEPSEESRSVSQSEKLPTVHEKISEVNPVVTIEEENIPPLSPPPATASSPVRSKRLVIETPEKVYQKPIMAEVRAEEDRTSEKSNGPKGTQRDRPQSMHSRITPEAEEKDQSQDDSNAGVAKLTQAFERSTRSNTISFGERKKRPEVLPKPKVPSKPSQSQTLERNYRFPVTGNKRSDTETSPKKSPKKQNDDIVIVLDETKENVLSSPTKKIAPKPKPLPKPVLKIQRNKPDVTIKTAEEIKQNIKRTPNGESVTNGSVKMSSTDPTDGKLQTVSKDAQADLPSFWARRNVFSPGQNSQHSTPPQDTPEKAKDKHLPFNIQLKTDTCAVCGSKVYQMEKFKVKDNIVHRSCIKCSVCKRLLSVGNFIMSQNKIYCKPHEPHLTISLTTF